jgi:CDP-4-dehydro-6-deoxyglucose reductase, E3
MTKICSVAVNGETFKAKAGSVLLDAALLNGVNLPHDCRSGLCGSCLTRVAKGTTIFGETATAGMVLACQARILSDLEIEAERVPEVSLTHGRIRMLRSLAADVFEIGIEAESRLMYLPGQYFNFKFEGFPARSYSATWTLDRRFEGSAIVLQVRRHARGHVSSHLGRRIRAGHPVVMEGPFGSAFFRGGKDGRLVLVSSGTGFAPIWSIASAALRENPQRHIVVVAGVRTHDSIYMAQALEWLAGFPNVEVIVTIGKRRGVSAAVRCGYPNDHVPQLNERDIVYACGPVQMIEAVSPMAAASQAQFFSDPFEPAAESRGATFLEYANKVKQFIAKQRDFGSTVANALPGLGANAS